MRKTILLAGKDILDAILKLSQQPAYGNRESDFVREVDHIIPVKEGRKRRV